MKTIDASFPVTKYGQVFDDADHFHEYWICYPEYF